MIFLIGQFHFSRFSLFLVRVMDHTTKFMQNARLLCFASNHKMFSVYMDDIPNKDLNLSVKMNAL